MATRPSFQLRVLQRRRWRWAGVAMTCLVLASGYYAYDMPAALNRQLREQLQLSHAEWQYWLAGAYAAYSLPNVAMPFYAPHLLLQFGARWLFIILCALALLGQMGVAASLLPSSVLGTLSPLWLLLIGRGLLGFGVESMGVAQSAFTCRWFLSSRRLSLAFALNVAMARLGAVVNDVSSPWITDGAPATTAWLADWLTWLGVPKLWLTGTVLAVLVGLLACMAGWLCSVVISAIDYWVEQRQLYLMDASMLSSGGQDTAVEEATPNTAFSERRVSSAALSEALSRDDAHSSHANQVSTSNASAVTTSAALGHMPFSSMRRQFSARDVRSIRRSYLLVDRVRRQSGVSRRQLRQTFNIPQRTAMLEGTDASLAPPQFPATQSTISDEVRHGGGGGGGASSVDLSSASASLHLADISNSLPEVHEHHDVNVTGDADSRLYLHVPEEPGRVRASTLPNIESGTVQRHVSPLLLPVDRRRISVAETVGTRGTRRRRRRSCVESLPYSHDLSTSTAPATLPWQFWLLCISMACFYCAVIPFVNIASDYIQTRWTTIGPLQAGLLMALPDLVSTLLVPICAELFDGFAYRGSCLSIIGFVMALVHLCLSMEHPWMLSPVGIASTLAVLGLCYGIFSAIFWTSLPHVLPQPELHPKGYAYMSSILNLSLAVAPFLLAKAIVYDATFITAGRLLALISALAATSAMFIVVLGVLDQPLLRNSVGELGWSECYDGSFYDEDGNLVSGYWSDAFSDGWESPIEQDDAEEEEDVVDVWSGDTGQRPANERTSLLQHMSPTLSCYNISRTRFDDAYRPRSETT